MEWLETCEREMKWLCIQREKQLYHNDYTKPMPTTLIAHLFYGKWQADSPLCNTHSNRWSQGKKEFHPPTEEMLTCSGSGKMPPGPCPRLLQQAPFAPAQGASLAHVPSPRPHRYLPQATSYDNCSICRLLNFAATFGTACHILLLETLLSPKVHRTTFIWHFWTPSWCHLLDPPSLPQL